jgi:hypothetical protein
LGEKVLTALDSMANLADSRLARAAFGRLQADPRTVGALLRRSIAVGPIRLCLWYAPFFHDGHAPFRQGRLDHQAV